MPTGLDYQLQALGLPSAAAATQASFGRSRYSTVPIGSVAYASSGTNSTVVAGTLYVAEVQIPKFMTITGIAVLVGTTGGTNNGLVALYDAGGNLLATSALAGALVGTAATFQTRDFITPVQNAIGKYFVAYQQNGTTATLKTIPVSTFIDCLTISQTGVFGTIPTTLTAVPSAVVADVGPFAYVY